MTCAFCGLVGGMNGVDKSVALTVGDRVSHRCPSMPHPMLVLTDAAFELRSSWREWIMAYMGLP